MFKKNESVNLVEFTFVDQQASAGVVFPFSFPIYDLTRFLSAERGRGSAFERLEQARQFGLWRTEGRVLGVVRDNIYNMESEA